jgi:hypothetical protein
MIGKNESMVRVAPNYRKIPDPRQEQTVNAIVPAERVTIQIERA